MKEPSSDEIIEEAIEELKKIKGHKIEALVLSAYADIGRSIIWGNGICIMKVIQTLQEQFLNKAKEEL